MDLLTELTILILAAFVGFEVISKIPNTLHTPLMSATNAIHGIVVLGGPARDRPGRQGVLDDVILVIAIAFGTINVVGGFLVTDRMLEMFKKKPAAGGDKGADEGLPPGPRLHRERRTSSRSSLFIIGLRRLTHPRTARQGNKIAAVGMAVAVLATLLKQEIGDWELIVLGVVMGTAVGSRRRAT